MPKAPNPACPACGSRDWHLTYIHSGTRDWAYRDGRDAVLEDERIDAGERHWSCDRRGKVPPPALGDQLDRLH